MVSFVWQGKSLDQSIQAVTTLWRTSYPDVDESEPCAVWIRKEREHIKMRAEKAAVTSKRLAPLKQIAHVNWAVGKVLTATVYLSKPPNCAHIHSF